MTALFLALLALPGPLQAPTCDPAWLPTEGAPPGLGGGLFPDGRAALVFDDGSGPKLYVGGAFYTAGGVPAERVAAWDGVNWSALGAGTGFAVNALAVFDDGTGPALYAGGEFPSPPNDQISPIARWNGSTWITVGGGVDHRVSALAVWDDGSGSALYAGGDFKSAGGVAANRIAKWNGQSWSALGDGLNSSVLTLHLHDDGGGEALYVGGKFTAAGGQPAVRLARWNGAQWSPVGAGANGSVTALASYPRGPNSRLYVGGHFSTIDGQAIQGLAAWDGSAFSLVGGGIQGNVNALAPLDDGSGSALHVGFQNGTACVGCGAIARWDGSNWSAAPGTPFYFVNALAQFPQGPTGQIYATGGFTTAHGRPVPYIIRLGMSGWEPLATGGTYLQGAVASICSFDDGTGPAMYVGGSFKSIGDQPISYLARWDGAEWSAVNGGPDGYVTVLKVFDFGSGPSLYLGGGFTHVGNTGASGVAHWDGTTWKGFGPGFVSGVAPSSTPGGVYDLEAYDDGSGLALYAAGVFTHSGGIQLRALARWNGSQWKKVGAGVPGSIFDLYALAVADLGDGPVLVAGGDNNHYLSGPRGVLRWNGSDLAQVGQGLVMSVAEYPGWVGNVKGLSVFDDGSGPRLYAGGDFNSSGTTLVKRMARWNGTEWEGVGEGADDPVTFLEVVDDGFGEALYAAGLFTSIGGVSTGGFARWDGAAWSSMTASKLYGINAMTAAPGPGGPVVLIGGGFTGSPAKDAYFTRWTRCGLEALVPVSGCLGNSVDLRTLSPGLVQGQEAAFESHSDQGDGLALLFAGQNGTDGSGCGLFVPALGELLLSSVSGLSQVGTAPTSLGTGAFQISIPTTPALVGKRVLLQSAHVLLSLPGAPLELSNGLLGRILL